MLRRLNDGGQVDGADPEVSQKAACSKVACDPLFLMNTKMDTQAKGHTLNSWGYAGLKLHDIFYISVMSR